MEPGVVETLFSPRGRLGRVRFVVLALAAVITWSLLLIAFEEVEGLFWEVMVGSLALVFLWVHTALEVKRWHDMNRSGAWVLLGWSLMAAGALALPDDQDIPAQGFRFLVSLVLVAIPGSRGANAYGPVPPR